jgi:hypothetical protein
MSTDDDELGYMWMKLKYTQKYLRANPDKTAEDAEREFLQWVDGFGIDSLIEMNNRVSRRQED